tara:strand:- start:1678 stop:2430 length:753 start_codon:yes stop_codon:yes gene_type:complete
MDKKAIIVDDEVKAQKNLSSLIEEFAPEIKILGTASTVKEAIQLIDEIQPDVVFLDVEMDGESGFDLLESIDHPEFDVVFVTAHDEYAIKAFKYAATDYLLKPIDIEELENCASNLSLKRSNNDREAQQRLLLDNIKKQQDSFSKIVLPTLENLLFVESKEIIRCESTDNYTHVYLNTGKKILVSKNIKHFEEVLEPLGFYRIHRSHLVNLNYIVEYYRGEGGYVIMKDESSIPVSRRKKVPFLDRIQTL